jgi:hypothetical protein
MIYGDQMATKSGSSVPPEIKELRRRKAFIGIRLQRLGEEITRLGLEKKDALEKLKNQGSLDRTELMGLRDLQAYTIIQGKAAREELGALRAERAKVVSQLKASKEP